MKKNEMLTEDEFNKLSREEMVDLFIDMGQNVSNLMQRIGIDWNSFKAGFKFAVISLKEKKFLDEKSDEYIDETMRSFNLISDLGLEDRGEYEH